MAYGKIRRASNRMLLEQLYRAQDKLCAHCGRPMYLPWKHYPVENRQYYASIDHLEARHVGGSDDLTNKVAMHRCCNSNKNHRPPTGCELIFHALVLARIDQLPLREIQLSPVRRATLADVWPKGREANA